MNKNIVNAVVDKLQNMNIDCEENIVASCFNQAEAELKDALYNACLAEYFLVKGNLDKSKEYNDLYLQELLRLTKVIKSKSTPKKQLIFVEEGSVDIDELENSLAITNPEIKVIAYRQGGRPPELINVENK